MHEGANNDEETNSREILKSRQSTEKEANEQKSATLFDVNACQRMSTGDPEAVRQLSKAEEPEAKYCSDGNTENSKVAKSQGCSKSCAGIKHQGASSFKVTVCTSRKRGKRAGRLKRSKRKVKQISNQVKKRTKKSLKRIQEIYRNFRAKRAMGFKCDLRRCESTVLKCSTTSCVKPDMLFSKFYKQNPRKGTGERRFTICCSTVRDTGTTTTNLDANYGRETKHENDKSTGTVEDKETNT